MQIIMKGRKVKNQGKRETEQNAAAPEVVPEAANAAENAAPEADAAPDPAKSELLEAQKALREAEAQAEDFKRKWYAVTAEYENYRRRIQALSHRG